MAVYKVCVALLVLVAVTQAMRGPEQRPRHGRMAPEGGQQGMGFGGQQGMGFGGGRSGRNWAAEDTAKYRTNLFNDDDVYGYEATYPGGDARFISYKTGDARSRRGPEFARSSTFRSGRDNMQQRENGHVGQ